MQYDDNAEKYGYEGEMTPMKCDELKSYGMGDPAIDEEYEMYKVADVDAVLAEKDREIALLKERICNGDVSRLTWIDDCIAKDKEIAELKAALKESEEARYEAGADAADYYQENRKLKRALWLARAEWARSSALSYHLIESHPDKDVAATYKRKANRWEKAKDKCLKKAEEYKK